MTTSISRVLTVGADICSLDFFIELAASFMVIILFMIMHRLVPLVLLGLCMFFMASMMRVLVAAMIVVSVSVTTASNVGVTVCAMITISVLAVD